MKGIYKSPIGTIEITATNDKISELKYLESNTAKIFACNDLIEECKRQLDEYIIGKRKIFNIPIELEGSEFQKNVWREVLNIPYGEQVSYLHIAKSINNEKSVRAVGMANNKNKIPIIIPCHRVIGSEGNLVGYGGGIWRKRWLLEHEKKHSNSNYQFDFFS